MVTELQANKPETNISAGAFVFYYIAFYKMAQNSWIYTLG